MIIGKSLTALGGGGLKPEISVTAKAGALLNLHFKDSSIILQSYQLGADEAQHTFIVNVSETAYVVEDATNGKSVEVLVDAVAQYNIEIDYKLWLYKDGDECEDVTGGWVPLKSWGSNLTYDGAYTLNNTYMAATVPATKLHALGIQTNNLIDVSSYSTVKAEVKLMSGEKTVVSAAITVDKLFIECVIFFYDNGSDYNRLTMVNSEVPYSSIFLNDVLTHSSTHNTAIYKVWLE